MALINNLKCKELYLNLYLTINLQFIAMIKIYLQEKIVCISVYTLFLYITQFTLYIAKRTLKFNLYTYIINYLNLFSIIKTLLLQWIVINIHII